LLITLRRRKTNRPIVCKTRPFDTRTFHKSWNNSYSIPGSRRPSSTRRIVVVRAFAFMPVVAMNVPPKARQGRIITFVAAVRESVSVGQTSGGTQRCRLVDQRQNWQFETHG